MPPRVLSDTDAAEIRRRYWWRRESFAALAREIGVDPGTIRQAAFGRGVYAEKVAR